MSANIATGITPVDSREGAAELLNPFVHHLRLETTAEKIKVKLLSFYLVFSEDFILILLTLT